MKVPGTSLFQYWTSLIAILLSTIALSDSAVALDKLRPKVFCKGHFAHLVPFAGIGISKSGQVEWNGEPVSEKNFKRRLKTEARKRHQLNFLITPAPDATHTQMAPVLAEIERAGIQNACLLGTN
jgi:biopolymer transport protein ExbD